MIRAIVHLEMDFQRGSSDRYMATSPTHGYGRKTTPRASRIVSSITGSLCSLKVSGNR